MNWWALIAVWLLFNALVVVLLIPAKRRAKKLVMRRT